MSSVAYVLIALPVLLLLYAYIAYPLLLALIARLKHAPAATEAVTVSLPAVSISLPVYNEEAQIRDVVESLLALDYPAHLRQIVVISDASTDRTDEIVSEYASRGVELLRLPQRAGKTSAENAAAPHLRGEIIVNTDASVRIRPDALRHLVAQFADAAVGVASGRDISVGAAARDANIGEAGYVNYEMRVRALETRVAGIIGASGCFYAVRAHLHRQPLPSHLSRDFAAALIAREHGYRSVSVDHATCLVPRTSSLEREYRRKVRTISRGMETLAHKAHLLNPFRYGAFAWMLFSHKVCRWSVPLVGPLALLGLLLLVPTFSWALVPLLVVVSIAGMAVFGWRRSARHAIPHWLGVITAAALTHSATMVAFVRALHGDRNASWEPTRRDAPRAEQVQV